MAVALPIVSVALIVGMAVCLGWLVRIVGTARDPVLRAVPGLEELRRTVREARSIVYPRGGDEDLGAAGLLVKTRAGGLVGWRVERGALVRTDVGVGPPRVVMDGVERIAVRRLGGRRPVVRVGIQRAGRSVVLLAAAPVAPLVTNASGEDAAGGDEEEAEGGT